MYGSATELQLMAISFREAFSIETMLSIVTSFGVEDLESKGRL